MLVCVCDAAAVHNSGDGARDNSYHLSDINKRDSTTPYEYPEPYEQAPVSHQSQTTQRHSSNVNPNAPYEQLQSEYSQIPEVYDQAR